MLIAATLALTFAMSSGSAPRSPPTALLKVGETTTFKRGQWTPDEIVTCVGDGDRLRGMVPGFLFRFPDQFELMVRRGRFAMRFNHGLVLTLLVKPDFSIVVACASHP
jgi:hypothetical protein